MFALDLACRVQTWNPGARRLLGRTEAETVGEPTDVLMSEKARAAFHAAVDRIRGERRIGKHTRIEVVTEGILTRLLQQDPALTDIALVIFDEFHERNLHGDIGLALARDSQLHLREDLKILVMSATLDGVAVAKLLRSTDSDAPVVESAGRQYPVDVFYQAREPREDLETQVAALIMRALREQPQGDVLVFLPGQREIRRTQQALEQTIDRSRVRIHALFGEGSPAQQQAALTPDADGLRKIILSTSIAETSLTIDGVRIVVDAGLVRTARFDPRRGMSGLITIPVSQATATQRAGRAGRQAPGACYRLWSEEQHGWLARFPAAEITQSDLCPLALELAQWGSNEQQLSFLDPPPPALIAQAREVLRNLGALDKQNIITAHGRAMAALPTHPRIAHMLLRAHEHGFGVLACDVAALLEERDIFRSSSRNADFHTRWSALRHGGGDALTRDRARSQAKRLQQLLNITDSTFDPAHEDKLGLMLALCYPERVAKRRSVNSDRWQLASGAGAQLADTAFSKCEWIAAAELDGEGRDARIDLAAALDPADLAEFFPESFYEGEEVLWSAQDDAVIARQVKRFGAIIISEQPLSQVQLPPEKAAQLAERTQQVLCENLTRLGFRALPLDEEARNWLVRVQWLQRICNEDAALRNFIAGEFVDFSEQALLDTLEQWLAPYLASITRRTQLTRVPWLDALKARLDYALQKQIEQLAPSHITVPTGSRIPLDYSGAQPVLAVRLQEMFGEKETPRVANDRVPVLLHLLSPRQTQLAVTQDLASFWQNAYKDVCKDMRGQYPKHYWPDNPLEAEPTRRSKAADDRTKKREQ